jgi:hypothetical protein
MMKLQLQLAWTCLVKQLTYVLRGMRAGLADAMRWAALLIFYIASPTIRERSFSCLVLNGAIYLGSIAAMELGWLPLMNWALPRTVPILRVTLQICWLYPMMLLSLVGRGGGHSAIASFLPFHPQCFSLRARGHLMRVPL